jgi:hypothetical protein
VGADGLVDDEFNAGDADVVGGHERLPRWHQRTLDVA